MIKVGNYSIEADDKNFTMSVLKDVKKKDGSTQKEYVVLGYYGSIKGLAKGIIEHRCKSLYAEGKELTNEDTVSEVLALELNSKFNTEIKRLLAENAELKSKLKD